MRKLTTTLVLFSMLFAMSCANLKEQAKEAASEAAKEAAPIIRDAGKELADYAAKRMEAAAEKLIEQAKTDIGGALKAVPGAAGAAVSGATADMVVARLKADPEFSPKVAEFERRVADDGLSSALQWLFAGGPAVVALGLARLWWRTRGALKATVQGIEGAGEAGKPIKAAVASAGGKAFDAEIQSALA